MYAPQKERSELGKSSKLCKACIKDSSQFYYMFIESKPKIIVNKEYLGYTVEKKPARTGQWNKLVEDDFALGFSKNWPSELRPIHQGWPKHIVLLQDGQLDSTTPSIPLELHFVDYLVHIISSEQKQTPIKRQTQIPTEAESTPTECYALSKNTDIYFLLY